MPTRWAIIEAVGLALSFVIASFYANYIIKAVNKSVDESLAELMNAMLHIDELREKVREATKNGQTEVDLTEVLK